MNLGAFHRMVKSERDLRTLRDQQESEVLRRVLFWLGAAVLLEAFVLLGNRFYFHYLISELGFAKILMRLFGALQYVGVILAVACFVWAIMAKKKDNQRGFCRLIMTAFFVSIAACSFLFLQVGSGSVTLLLVGIPAVAGLIMIYYLYQREFFLVALMSGIGIFGLWMFRAGSSRYTTVFYVLTAIALCFLLFVAVLSVHMQKHAGNIKWKGELFPILKQDANYHLIWVTCALVALSLLLGLLLGATLAYYALLTLVIWIFIVAVYFTSRLM